MPLRATVSSILPLVVGVVSAGMAAPPVAIAQGAPVVTSMTVNPFDSRPDDTYRRQDTIEVSVVFDQPVTVVGDPNLALTIGSQTRLASLLSSRTYGANVGFTYVVQQSDLDPDGISVAADALGLNGGTIRNAEGLDANLSLADFTLTDDPALKVDGRNVGVQNVTFRRNGDASAVGLAERIRVALTLGDHVTLTGTPHLALTIGDETRLALYESVLRSTYLGSGQRTSQLRFVYDVQASDTDTNGITLPTDAIRLNGGAIRDSLERDANLQLGSLADEASGFTVNGGVDNAPAAYRVYVARPGLLTGRDTFQLGETIRANVVLTEFVAVTGEPSLNLTIGTRTRPASHVRNRAASDGAAVLTFIHHVEAEDLDTDGLSVAADAIVLNGGSIRDLGGTDASLDLGERAIADLANGKVDGRIDGPPELRLNTFSRGDDTYGRSERILTSVLAYEPLTVTGDPTLALTIGDQTRQMTMYEVDDLTYLGGSILYFRYDVQAADLDEDGLSVAADALALNGGSIRDARGNDATLDFGRYAIADDARLKVNGSVNVAPVVTRMGFYSRPSVGDVYRLGEEIEAYVGFDKALEVIGTPRLAVDIGDQTRQMTYDGLHSSGVLLRFLYTVQAMDQDLDGIEIGSNALTLNGGAIRDAEGNDANLSLADARHPSRVQNKVDGTRQATGTTPE